MRAPSWIGSLVPVDVVRSALRHVVVFRPDLEVVSAASFGQTDEQQSSQAPLSHFGPFDPLALKTK